MCATPPRGHAEFAVNNGQEGHALLMDNCPLSILHCQRFVREGNGARFGLLPAGKFRAIHIGWRRAVEGPRSPSRGMAGWAAPGFSILNFRATTGACHIIAAVVNRAFIPVFLGGGFRFLILIIRVLQNPR